MHIISNTAQTNITIAKDGIGGTPIWKQIPVHHLSPMSTPLSLHTLIHKKCQMVIMTSRSELRLSWCAPLQSMLIYVCCCSGSKLAYQPQFCIYISLANLWSGMWGIWRWNTADACFMIVQALSNGQEYRLILSTSHQYVYNIDEYKNGYAISAFYTTMLILKSFIITKEMN